MNKSEDSLNVQFAGAIGDVELFKNLLNLKDDTTHQCDTTIGWTISFGQPETFRYILNITGVDTPTYKMKDLIDMTIYSGLLDVSKVLMEYEDVKTFIKVNYEDVVHNLKKYTIEFKELKNNQFNEILEYIISEFSMNNNFVTKQVSKLLYQGNKTSLISIEAFN